MNRTLIAALCGALSAAMSVVVFLPSRAGAQTPGEPAAASATSEVPDGAFDCLIEPMTMAELGSAVQGVVARLLVERREGVSRWLDTWRSKK